VLVSMHRPPPPQVIVPAGHPQTPDVHTPPAPHARPHPPQLFTSVETSLQLPAHATSPVGHPDAHAPPVHTCVAVHVVPHAPQLRGSLLVSTHTPPHVVVQVAPSPEVEVSVPPSPFVELDPESLLLHATPSATIRPAKKTEGARKVGDMEPLLEDDKLRSGLCNVGVAIRHLRLGRSAQGRSRRDAAIKPCREHVVHRFEHLVLLERRVLVAHL
jgi:hypothetical protein